jgi:hypothetical protein
MEVCMYVCLIFNVYSVSLAFVFINDLSIYYLLFICFMIFFIFDSFTSFFIFCF